MANPDTVGSPAAPARTFVARLGFALAIVALAGYLAAAVLLVLPVEVPRVQDCGAPGAYVLTGRIDVRPDPQGFVLGADGRPQQLSDADAAAVRRAPCQDRVADRAVPAGLAILGATALGVVAAVLSLFRPRRLPPTPPVPWGTDVGQPTGNAGSPPTSPSGPIEPAVPPATASSTPPSPPLVGGGGDPRAQ